MKSTITSAWAFFDSWQEVCKTRTETLLVLWDRRKEYTSEIFHAEDSVVKALAKMFNLTRYNNYYSLDTIFFDEEVDRVHCAPFGQTWVQNIRIAFEHEHIFRSGLFQEVSHLLITRAELRVLVSYPNSEEELQRELKSVAKIISQSAFGNLDPAFLLITGTRINSNKGIEWRAYTYQGNDLMPL